MKLADSLNPATQAENIKKLNAGLEAVDAKTLPGTSTATTGQILKLTGENKTPSWADEYTPPAYSTTEVNTGQKWIDGKYIYSIVYTFTSGSDNSALKIGEIANFSNAVNIISMVTNTSGFNIEISTFFTYITANGGVYSVAGSSSYQNCPARVIVYYTKTPETRDDDTEPETKKTKKKATK